MCFFFLKLFFELCFALAVTHSQTLLFLSFPFPLPTKTDCERYYNGPPDFLPNVGKGYYTPANRADWKLKDGDCRTQADKVAAG